MKNKIIEEFLKIILPDKKNWKSQLFVRTKAYPLGILLDGKLAKEKLKWEMEKALTTQRKEIEEGIEKESFVEVITQKKMVWLEDIKALLKKQLLK